MLAERQKMTVSDNSRGSWTDADWDLVAAELKRQNPTRNASSYYRFDFTTMELEDAAEQVIPQERQRSFESFESVKRQVWNAFERMKPNARPALKIVDRPERTDNKIHWTAEQWDLIIEELHFLDSTLFANNCTHLNMQLMNQAQSIFPPRDRRNFKQLVTTRLQLMKHWEQFLARKRDAAQPVIVDFESGPIMEPPARKSDGDSAIATAMHEAFQADPVEPKKRRTRVDREPEEWVQVAREMRRQNPHIDFFMSNFSVIDLPAIREAQRVLPLERRMKLTGKKGLQGPLVAAFKTLLEEVIKEEQEPLKEQAIGESMPDMTVSLQEVDPVAVQVARPEPSPVMAEKQADMAEFSFNAAVLNAAAPLVNLMVDEVVKRLLPQLSSALVPELLKTIKDEISASNGALLKAISDLKAIPGPVALHAPAHEHAAQQVSGKLTAKELSEFFPVPEPKAKKPKIVLLGPSGRQKNDIEGTFPEYRFVFIEDGHGIKEAAVDCELFIVYTSHFNAANKAAVKKYVPFEKVRQLAGSLSSVKHQIHTWKAMKKDV